MIDDGNIDFAAVLLGAMSEQQRAKAASVGYVATTVGDAIEMLADQIRDLKKELAARIDEIEKNGARFRGVYQRSATYRRGDQVTHKSSLWTALGDVPEGATPGADPALWQLAAKGTN
jgi:hypothetical protein